jgi:hypothetical protein
VKNEDVRDGDACRQGPGCCLASVKVLCLRLGLEGKVSSDWLAETLNLMSISSLVV